MDQEIVQLTNKLLEAKNTIDHLEELNVRTNSHLCKNVQLPGQSSKCQVFHSETTGSKNYCVINFLIVKTCCDPIDGLCKTIVLQDGLLFCLMVSVSSERALTDAVFCLQERYRQDCNLAVQLLKCNKSHFRNHKFADVSNFYYYEWEML